MVSTRSVAVLPSGNSPESLTPTTRGMSMLIGWPSIAASASMPPTPQPSTPRPFTIGVCESVPASVSGNATPSSAKTTRARCSILTWWQIPVPGGTTRSARKACGPSAGTGSAPGYAGTPARCCAPRHRAGEVVGDYRVIDDQFGRAERVDPGRVAAEGGHRLPHGSQVHDCTAPGEVLQEHPGRVNWISADGSAAGSHPASASIWVAVTSPPSSLRSRFSSSTLG